mgnify:CR=1 FL=1
MTPQRAIIMGAAGRDFHNFNTFFRQNDLYEVVAFTAAQIPDIEGRKYPPELAGEGYPNGIPIESEDDLPRLIRDHQVDLVVFSYSDVPHQYVMDRASTVMAAGADFALLGPDATMLPVGKPVISVTAVRTGAGKSQTTRRVAEALKTMDVNTVVIRHPMPYGDLTKQIVQRFASYDDLDKHQCTIEEREEYEPHLNRGNVVYAGVDYERIVRRAEDEADVVLWDGGNNDFSFYQSDLYIVVADPHRAGHELTYYPGAVNLRMADVVVINKVDTAERSDVETVKRNVQEHNPDALVIEAASPITVADPSVIEGKRVLVVEDGPTLTHGEMAYGAGAIAAEGHGAKEIISPYEASVGSIRETFDHYPQVRDVLPAMGYGDQQMADLEATIRNAQPEAVVIATPIDLNRLIDFDVPTTRVTYDLEEQGTTLQEVIQDRLGDAIKRG